MGLLGNIFSAGDRAKRNLLDFVQNPVESVQQAVGHVNDRARAFNELNDAALAETNASGRFNMGAPATSKLAQTLADAYNPIAMTVYHGSPHLFSRFDASKIGTGEGAQVYGHGLYFAESPDVANRYKNGLTNPYPQLTQDLEHVLPPTLKGKAPDWADAIQSGKAFGDLVAEIKQPWQKNVLSQKKDAIEALIAKQQSGGSLYKIDLPDDAIAKMLDWDKPLSQQSESIRQAVAGMPEWQAKMQMRDKARAELAMRHAAGKSLRVKMSEGEFDPTGQKINDVIKQFFDPIRPTFESSQQAAEAFSRAGIPGIRYLDGGFRGVGQGSSNFVVFPGNEGLLTILERNGKPISR